MNKNRLKEIILEELGLLYLEADDDKEKEKDDKAKADIEKQKMDLDTKKLDFQKAQAADSDREADKRDAEKEKEETEEEKPEGGKPEGEKPEATMSFKTQGEFYKNASVELENLQLSNGNLLDDDEVEYVALAVQASNGRIDNGFEKFLRKGKAGNVRGRDFSDEDIKRIMVFCKNREIVR